MNRCQELHRALGLAAVLALGAPGLAGARGAPIDAALRHARFAAKAENAEGMGADLRHVVNGPSGSGGLGFDANALDPCQDMGGGAIPAATRSRKDALEDARNEAIFGLQVDAYEPAHGTGPAVVTTLENAGGG